MVHEALEQLVKLQEIDSKIYDADKSLAQIPELLRVVKDEYESLANSTKDLENQYQLLKTELDEILTLSAEKKALLDNAKKKKEAVHNSKEYEAALKEIDNLEKSVSELLAKEQVLLARISETDNSLKITSVQCAEKNESYLSEKAKKEHENQALFDTVSILRKEREQFASTVQKSIILKYEKVRRARSNSAVVTIEGEFCTGCRMKIPAQLAVEVKKEKDILQCPHCQRFLHPKKV